MGACLCAALVQATPANKAALQRHYATFLAEELNQCSTCHLPAKLEHPPESLDEFPHNPFGARLRALGEQLRAEGGDASLPERLQRIAREDSDGDGTPNELELLLGRRPGDAMDVPTPAELGRKAGVQSAFAAFLNSYRWNPFRPVQRTDIPAVKNTAWPRNPIDHFIAAAHEKGGMKPRPPARKEILLRRVYLDLIGLNPSPEEQRDFANDAAADAYERVVDRLLADPRYGERWGRHWMDIWRYSDWAGWSGGKQIRDSKPHIWRWRDWIVESLNEDRGYDRMLMEMLAADELAPEDPDALRATGYLVRNFKLLSREQWLEDTIKHTSQAFLGLTLGCAKCHDHMHEPISQKEYYQVRAIFEPHEVRTDRVPGELDREKAGLARVFDAKAEAPTWLFARGDERSPMTNEVIQPNVPRFLGGRFEPKPASLPRLAHQPDKRPFVIRDTIAASESGVRAAERTLAKLRLKEDAPSARITEAESALETATVRHESLLATLRVELLEDEGQKGGDSWKSAAEAATEAQRRLAVFEARQQVLVEGNAKESLAAKAESAAQALAAAESAADQSRTDKARKESEKAAKELETTRKKLADAEGVLSKAEMELNAEPGTAYKPRPAENYPKESTGRRLAFARWVADPKNPLTARVAVNHIWGRHFGRGIVPSVTDFGGNGQPPTHPELLDWLAVELISQGWRMKAVHRLIVTSSTYCMASTPDGGNLALDPDNLHLWRMNSQRVEAELVRDNVLSAAGRLDLAMGGPEIDHEKGLESPRRSLYLRVAAEKEVEFLKIFDGPNVAECYERRPSVMPQQALAMANSEIALREARFLAADLLRDNGSALGFVQAAFSRVLAREPSDEELRHCLEFLRTGSADENAAKRLRQNLVLVLFNHNDFVTVR